MARAKRDRRDRPAYTLTEAANCAGLPTSTLTTWVAGRARSGRRRTPSLIDLASKKPRLLSFTNLVEVFVLAAVRREHKVPLQRIRTALNYVKKQMGLPRPLIQARFETDGLDLFIDKIEEGLVNASQGGQVALKQAFESRLRRIEWDHKGAPVKLFPVLRLGEPDPPRTVVIDPNYGFGHPVIAGTGIRTSIVIERYRAGESVADLAKDYDVGEECVQDAVRCAIQAAS